MLWLLSAVQFVNVLEFMMVMPLGPDFAAGLGASIDDVGIVAGSYTAAAAISGLAGALILDRFDRRPALFVAMTGLVVSTFAAGLATSLHGLMLARAVAGLFGGPATSLALSILSDQVPAERRGRALAQMMSAFSIASVVGIPGALELAHRGSWRTPFWVVGGLGFVVAVSAVAMLPSMRDHLAGRDPDADLRGELRRLVADLAVMSTNALFRAAWLGHLLLFLGSFLLVPNIAGYLTGNLGYPREGLGGLYMMGGVASYVVARVVGVMADRYGAVWTASIGVVLLVSVSWAGFGWARPLLPVPVVFVLFMVAMTFRNMSMGAQASRVPGPQERARFASVQSVVQHLASSLAAGLSSALLTTDASGRLLGMDRVLWVMTAVNLSILPVAAWIHRGMAARDAAVSGRAAT